MWIQNGALFELGGAHNQLVDNGLAGLAVRGTSEVRVHDVTISGTSTLPWIHGALGLINVGDGIHALVDNPAALDLADISLAGNERVGVLIDFLEGSMTDARLTNISVDAAGSANGVVAQDQTRVLPPGDWDTGVTRLGSAAANDSALNTRFDVVGVIEPMNLPMPEM